MVVHSTFFDNKFQVIYEAAEEINSRLVWLLADWRRGEKFLKSGRISP